jgi:hypothetical protein
LLLAAADLHPRCPDPTPAHPRASSAAALEPPAAAMSGTRPRGRSDGPCPRAGEVAAVGADAACGRRHSPYFCLPFT